MKKFKVIILSLLFFTFCLPTNTLYAAQSKTTQSNQINKLIEVKTYPAPLSTPMDRIILTATEANTLNDVEIAAKIKSRTHFDSNQIQSIVSSVRQVKSAAKSSKSESMIASSSGMPFTSFYKWYWYVEPYIERTEKWISYSGSWVGIDAYRSSVGKTNGYELSTTISTSIGFSGAEEILRFANLSLEYNKSQTATISSTYTCPAWTTYNERPYTAFWRDYWLGTRARGLYYLWWDGSVTFEGYDSKTLVTGINDRLYVSTCEVWSRVNTYTDVNASTPMPPTGQPSLSW